MARPVPPPPPLPPRAAANASVTCVCIALRCSSGGARERPSAAAACSTPTMPAAGSEWPWNVFDAARETTRGPCSTSAAAPSSMGSPSGVPVPCICSAATADGPVRAPASAARITACCAGPLGAVRLLLRPS
eukprot:354678-Chlamydomonas_euryale.AAC.1